MRFFHFFSTLFIASFTLLSVLPEPVQSCDRRFRGGPVYYQPMPAYYHQPYYAPPLYHQPAYAPGHAQPMPAATVDVSAIDKVGFKPKTINVAPGTTVRWVNQGKEPHTVTSRDGLFDSGPMSPGGTFSVTFQRPGTYHYFCRPHEKVGMVGTIVVGSGGPGAGSGGPGY
jgi:plastocyanin